MSSPLDRDIGPDDISPYAPKWARDAADARRGRPQEAGANSADNPNDDTRRSGAHSATVNEAVFVDAYRVPHSLEPTLIPQPPPVPRTHYILGILARVSVATSIAAVIALSMLVQKQDLTSFEGRFSGQNAQIGKQSKAVTTQVAEPVAQSTVANVVAVQPPGTPPQAPATAVLESSATGAAQPFQRTVEISANPPKAFPIRQLEHEEIVDLVRRGEAFIAIGDIPAARLVLQRAAEAGGARAALMLAGTYDPIMLEKLGIQGLASDNCCGANLVRAGKGARVGRGGAEVRNSSEPRPLSCGYHRVAVALPPITFHYQNQSCIRADSSVAR
jgi:hypothetical protein